MILIATKIIPYEGLKLINLSLTIMDFYIATKIIPYEGLKPCDIGLFISKFYYCN